MPSYSQTSQKFIPQTLTLSNSAQSSLLYLLRIKFHGPLTEFKSFLDEGGQFTDTTSLVSEDFLCVSCADDDFSSGRGDSDFAA